MGWRPLLQKGCTLIAAASATVYQLLTHGLWFSPDTTASPTIKTGRHDIAEILLKEALKHQKSTKPNLINSLILRYLKFIDKTNHKYLDLCCPLLFSYLVEM